MIRASLPSKELKRIFQGREIGGFADTISSRAPPGSHRGHDVRHQVLGSGHLPRQGLQSGEDVSQFVRPGQCGELVSVSGSFSKTLQSDGQLQDRVPHGCEIPRESLELSDDIRNQEGLVEGAQGLESLVQLRRVESHVGLELRQPGRERQAQSRDLLPVS